MLGTADDPIRVLRVIARLNVGGPSLHVSYLSEGLAERGYATTLAAGTISEGEASMAFVAEQRGIEVESIPGLQREMSPLKDAAAVKCLRDIIRRDRPHILHTHTAKAGTVGRTAARLAGERTTPVVVHTFHGHMLKGEFDPVRTHAFRAIERSLARSTDALVAVSPEVRDELVEVGVAPAVAVRRRSPRNRALRANGGRLRRSVDPRVARHPSRSLLRRLGRPDVGCQAARGRPEDDQGAA